MNIPENLKYTNDHEWIKVDGNIGTIGVTDYAQGELGDIIYIDIPELKEVGKEGNKTEIYEATANKRVKIFFIIVIFKK